MGRGMLAEPVDEIVERAPPAAVELGAECCAVEHGRTMIGGTVLCTHVHQAGCPVWSAR
jgi:hypothetical protein